MKDLRRASAAGNPQPIPARDAGLTVPRHRPLMVHREVRRPNRGGWPMASMRALPILGEFSAPYAEDDEVMVAVLVREAALPADAERQVDRTARRLIEAIRTTRNSFGSIDELLQEFSLSTREGLALMVLAEALLRVPDQATTDQFIEDKLREGDFVHHVTRSEALFVNASAWALGDTSQVVQGRETPQDVISALT